jgi:hypothetical protein
VTDEPVLREPVLEGFRAYVKLAGGMSKASRRVACFHDILRVETRPTRIEARSVDLVDPLRDRLLGDVTKSLANSFQRPSVLPRQLIHEPLDRVGRSFLHHFSRIFGCE